MPALFTPHPRPLTVLHGDLENHAAQPREVVVGTPGSVVERTNASGFRFYAHAFYDGEGRKRERYLGGPIGAAAADTLAKDLRERIRELKELVPSFRLLGREGWNVVDGRTFATLATLANHGVFRAGGILIGSHAYGLLLNRLGIRAAAYATEDIDLARREALAFEQPPGKGLLEMLQDSGVPFVPIPQLDGRQPATSWKAKGRARFHVDLLVPSKDESFPLVPIPELHAHATGLPYLAYLLAETQPAMAMGREGCCAVRIPLPERFALHKLVISRLRTGRDAKAAKDVHQACVVAAAVAEFFPGALEQARAAVPRRAKRHLASGLALARPMLEGNHPRAWEELAS